ncbi:MAG: hypothetical protein IIX75_03350 [Clostridia bacterium]|jgi:hypothetical protein|nr:hypothetical protein [Clostridia bacterium]
MHTEIIYCLRLKYIETVIITEDRTSDETKKKTSDSILLVLLVENTLISKRESIKIASATVAKTVAKTISDIQIFLFFK